MGEIYEPLFTMTGKITNLIVEIGELVGAITTHEAMNPKQKEYYEALQKANIA